jgi:hypothetical protein
MTFRQRVVWLRVAHVIPRRARVSAGWTPVDLSAVMRQPLQYAGIELVYRPDSRQLTAVQVTSRKPMPPVVVYP